MRKHTKLFAIAAIGVFTLTGCTQAIDETQEPVEEVVSEVVEPVEVVPEESADVQLASYEDFTQERYDELLGKESFAIFFHASWCPDCVYLEGQIKENIASLPKDAVILKANFDTENKLKQEYGITVQSTVVVVGKDGKATPTLFGPSFDDLNSAITKSL